MTDKNIKFIDLFAGIGGFHKALQLVAEENNFNIECVFVSEIDKYAIETYSKNFKIDKEKILNIRSLDDNVSQVPDHDFLFAGFPCQAFSNAGNKKGFLDNIRGTLFFDIVKILNIKKPKYILLENVKHLIKHDNGNTWEIITKTLNEIGYSIPAEPLILSPDKMGIPQNRERVFIPGILREKSGIKEKNITINIDLRKYEKVKIDYKEFLEEKPEKKYFLNKKNEKDKYLLKVFEAWNSFLKNVKKPHGRTLPVIWAFEFSQTYPLDILPVWKQKYITDMRIIYEENKKFIDKWLEKYDVKNWKKREQKFEWQAEIKILDIKDSFIQLRQSGIRCKKPTKFPTLVAMVQVPLIYDKMYLKWRYLTPREVSNLQSFPKNYVLYKDILNDERADFITYKQFGNSVNIKVVSFIQKYLLENF